MNKQDLLDLKDEINEAKSEVSKLEGRQEHLMQQLKDDWGCASFKKAKKKIEEFKSEIKKLDDKIEHETEKLQENYEL